MKLTKDRLKQIIKEELEEMMVAEAAPGMRGNNGYESTMPIKGINNGSPVDVVKNQEGNYDLFIPMTTQRVGTLNPQQAAAAGFKTQAGTEPWYQAKDAKLQSERPPVQERKKR